MAKVWFFRDSDNPTTGGPEATLPLAECVAKLNLKERDFVCDLSSRPRFGKSGDRMAVIRGYQHVVVQVDEDEAKRLGWKPGFYRSQLSPQQASKVLQLST